MVTQHCNVEAVPAAPGITRRTLANGPSLMLVEFSLEAGHTLPTHTHPHEQAGYIVAGRLRLEIGGTTQILTTGDTYHVLPNVPHGAYVLETAIVLDAFTPPRQDYIARPDAHK